MTANSPVKVLFDGRMKEFVFPSGRITTCMGYEPFAILELLKQVD